MAGMTSLAASLKEKFEPASSRHTWEDDDALRLHLSKHCFPGQREEISLYAYRRGDAVVLHCPLTDLRDTSRVNADEDDFEAIADALFDKVASGHRHPRGDARFYHEGRIFYCSVTVGVRDEKDAIDRRIDELITWVLEYQRVVAA
jgi:hypothetical protein